MHLAEHQRAAVRQLLDVLRRRRGALLADEPGLGKSFVAAAVAGHFEQSGSAVELLVPSTLLPQWRNTITRFGIEATLATHHGIVRDSLVPDESRPRLIVVDEAHAFRNPRTQRYDALARRSIGAHVLLVTATPICNAVDDLEALIGLIAADDSLRDCGVPSIDIAFASDDRESIEAISSALIIRRGRAVLPFELQFGDLARSVVRYRVDDIDGAIAPLIDSLSFPSIGNPTASALLRRFLWRRLESSEAALLETIRRQLRFYDRALEALAAGRPMPKRDYRRAFGHEEDRDAFQRVLFWELWLPAAPNGGEAILPLLLQEVATLKALREHVERSPCRKRLRLIEICAATADPMLIFTSSIATARDLVAALAKVRRCGLVSGRDRDTATVIERFRRGTIDVLVSTDLAAEGLNLQRAGVVVHYDIPWNPVKLEQRNGRAHRIGQKRQSVRAIYFLPHSDPTRIVATVSAKNRERRRVLRAPAARRLPSCAGMRPRFGKETAAFRFFGALERAGLDAPAALARRHRAGVERVLDQMSREFLDEERLRRGIALAAADAPPSL